VEKIKAITASKSIFSLVGLPVIKLNNITMKKTAILNQTTKNAAFAVAKKKKNLFNILDISNTPIYIFTGGGLSPLRNYPLITFINSVIALSNIEVEVIKPAAMANSFVRGFSHPAFSMVLLSFPSLLFLLFFICNSSLHVIILHQFNLIVNSFFEICFIFLW
jgi:hypothetical protein